MRVLLCILIMLLASCGGGGGGGTALLETAANTTATYQILDLANGTIATAAAIPDLLTDVRYRTTHMVFRLVPRGTAMVGASAASFAAQEDEYQRAVDMPKYYLAVFEITQGQWQRLAGTQPWLDLVWASGSDPVTAIGDTLPAYGLSGEEIDAALANWRASHSRHLVLPSDDQWEYACRGGATTLYSWGDSRRSSEVASYAVVFETGADNGGPQPVGERTANAYGLHDMHGNCWELTSNSNLRGGSWHDPISLARAANRNHIDPDTPHALVGARLLYLP